MRYAVTDQVVSWAYLHGPIKTTDWDVRSIMVLRFRWLFYVMKVTRCRCKRNPECYDGNDSKIMP